MTVSHLVAYFGNEPENMSCALFSARNALYTRSNGARIEGYGLGFIQGGDVLLQKKPRADATEVDLYAMSRDLKADALVARVGLDAAGNRAAEDADPFRFRSWLFGSVGAVPAFDQIRDRWVESIPDFLRRNVRGHSASEHLFHLFLAYLHDAGTLESPAPAPAQIRAALHHSLSFVDRMLSSTGASPEGYGLEIALVATNGRSLVATSCAQPLQFLRIDGIADCPVCQGKNHVDRHGRRISHENLRAVIIEAGTGLQSRAGWQTLPDRAALVIGHDRIPHVVPAGE
jgi:glutamine amidotransferase